MVPEAVRKKLEPMVSYSSICMSLTRIGPTPQHLFLS